MLLGSPNRRRPSMRSALPLPLPLSELRMLVPPLLQLPALLSLLLLSGSMQRQGRQLPRASVTIGLQLHRRIVDGVPWYRATHELAYRAYQSEPVLSHPSNPN